MKGALEGFKAQPEYQIFRRAYAERKAPLVIVSGSGLSASAGLPTWPRLRASLQQEAENKAKSLASLGEALLLSRVDSLRRQSNSWVAFKLLKEILTPPVFDALIEKYLTPADDVDVPESYRILMGLKPTGLVTLNLDRFAGESLAEAFPGKPVTPIYGKELAQRWHSLRAAKTFLVYLHGGLHDPASWVLTQDDLEEIQRSEGRDLFLRSLYADYLVLLVGVSADDIALSQPLLSLTTGGLKPKNVFWLTTRIDRITTDWASGQYVSLIRYGASSPDEHVQYINELVTDCLSFSSVDVVEPPLQTPLDRFGALPAEPSLDPDDLAQKEPEKIRYAISALLQKEITESAGNDVYDLYRTFCQKYDYPVDRAFYKSKNDRFREWFGYKLNFPALGRGNFGEVYSAETPEGEIVAVKIMHKSIFGNDEMLMGFRRGAKSMEIVTSQNVLGMVPIKERFELPPTIVMPFVEGVNLEDALQIRPDLPWLLKLAVARTIGLIVATGHALPQTILHRDLKPSNIMIKNFEYQGVFEPEIVVLDFDMSWHKGSRERDVVFESRDDFGYLAPEQTVRSPRYTTRNTRVDSYGFGMILFYMFGLDPPRANEALSDAWLSRALKATQWGYDGNWKSAPHRLARLITRATQVEQSARIDFASMVRELEYLDVAVRDAGSLDNSELWAEEMMARSGLPYAWDDNLAEGTADTAGGLVVKSSGNFRSNSVTWKIQYADTGMRERASLAKYLTGATTKAESILKGSGWKILDRHAAAGEAIVRGEYDVDALKRNQQPGLIAAAAALKEFTFQ